MLRARLPRLWLPLRVRPRSIAAEEFAGHAELVLVNDALSRPHARSRCVHTECQAGSLPPAPLGRRVRLHGAHFSGEPAYKRAAECDGNFVRGARCGFSMSPRGFRVWIPVCPPGCSGCQHPHFRMLIMRKDIGDKFGWRLI